MKHVKLIIVCIAVLAFSACGNTADTSASVDVSNVSDTETASETTAETTAEKITEDTESLTETSEEPAEKEENIDIVPRMIDMGDYKVNISVDNSTWYGAWTEFTDRDKILINSFFDNLDADELQEIIHSGAKSLNTDIPDTVEASLHDFFFFDCDGDGDDEILALLEFDNISEGFGNSYAVYYADSSAADFVFSGAHLHRSVFFAAVDSQPFIAEFELAMGYPVDPVVAAKRVFTFSEDRFVPYTVPEGKSLCVRVSEGFNRLYLFNTDPDDNTGYYYMEEIADGEIEQTLAWIDGKLTVTEGFEAE